MNLLADGHTITGTAGETLDAPTTPWPTPAVFQHLPACWLSALARDFVATYEISEFGAVALLLSAVSAAAGGCAWLRWSDGLAIAPTLNTLFIGAGGSFRSAADNAWSVARTRLGGAPDVIEDITTARCQIIELRTRLASIDQQIKEMEVFRKHFADFEKARLVRAQLYEEQTRITEQLAQISRSVGQRLLIENGPLAVLLEPGKVSLDRSIHCLCTSGTITARLTTSSARFLADLADLTAHVWTERFTCAAPAANPNELLSLNIIVSESQAATFLRSSRIRSSALIDQFLMIGLCCPADQVRNSSPAPADAWSEFSQVCDELVKAREALLRTVYRLNREAEEEIGRYVRDRNAAARGLGLERSAIFDRIRGLVSKFALMLHLCSEHRQEVSLGMETVKAACALADAALSGHLGLQRELAMREQTAVKQEGDVIEMIVERLLIRGPLNRRQLAQSFHDQKYTHWGPMLAQALASGRVARLPDGRFDLLQKNE